jgi:RNA polymerase sigma factor (sigma-70 family)
MTVSAEAQPASATRDRSHDKALESLYSEHAPSLRAWLAARVHRSHVDDVSQEVWLRVLGAYATQFDGRKFRSWLFTVARNCLIDRARKKREYPWDDKDASPPDRRKDGPDREAIGKEFRRHLADCMAGLGELRRTIVEERLSGADYEDVIVALGLTKQQAFQHFFAAKKLLRACMQEKYPEISA